MAGSDPTPGVVLGVCRADVVDLATLRNRNHVLRTLATRRGMSLPALGRLVLTGDMLILGVRPERWLLLTSPVAPGVAAATWQEACTGAAAAIDLSCAFAALHLAGPRAREALARGCRLDLDPDVFPAGRVAATIIAQVATILAALSSGILILTPTSTARHFREWLAGAARPFGLAQRAETTVTARTGDQFS
jgi:sarcosine oxidase subunit gamma